jgi:hypothetical protein
MPEASKVLFKPTKTQSYKPSGYWGNYQFGTIPYIDPRVGIDPKERFTHKADARLARMSAFEALKRGLSIDEVVWPQLMYEATFGKYSPQNPLRVNFSAGHPIEKYIQNPIPATSNLTYGLNYLTGVGLENYRGRGETFYDTNIPVKKGAYTKIINQLKEGFKTEPWQKLKSEVEEAYNNMLRYRQEILQRREETSKIKAMKEVLLPEEAGMLYAK